MANRTRKTLQTASGLKLRKVGGFYLPLLPPGTKILSTEELLRHSRLLEEEEDFRQARLAGLLPDSEP